MVLKKTGAIGGHFIGDAGFSNEAIAAYADVLAGKYATVVNDGNGEVKTSRALMGVGVTVIGREKTDTPPNPFDDDDADHPSKPKPAAWVERFKWRYPDDAIIWTAGNELGTNPEIWQRTCDWVKSFAELSANANHRTCAYNTSVQNPVDRIAYWKSQKPALEALVANHGIVGLHRGERPGFEGDHALAELEADIQELQKYGVEIVITELCGSEKTDYGYKYYYKTSEEAVEQTDKFAALMAKYGVRGTYFTYTEWSKGHGFGFHGDTVFKNGLIRINASTPVRAFPTPPIVEPPVTQPTIFDLADYIIPNGKPYGLGGVHGSSGYEIVQSRRLLNGYGETAKNGTFERIWFDAVYIYRGLDTSAVDKDEVYAQFTDGRYGAVWCRRFKKIGDISNRSPDVQHYHADGRLKNADNNIASQLKLAAHFASLTFPETSVTVSDVIELHWLMGGTLLERYWYAKGIGLVGFGAEGITGGYHSRIAVLNETRTPTPRPLAWFVEPLPPPIEKVVPPVSTYPDPTTLGTPTPGIITATRANVANVRTTPSVNGAFITTVKKDDMVLYRPKTVAGDGFVWTYLESHGGYVSDVATIGAVPKPVEPPIKSVDDIVFVSQLGTDADLRNNDCIVPPSIAWAKLRLKRSGFGDMPLLKVDNLIPLSPLSGNDNPVSLSKAQEFITSLGVPHKYRNNLTPDEIVNQLDAGLPPILLVNYRWIKQGGKRFGHYLLVVAYNEDGFWLNDSYEMGERFYISRDNLIKAQTDLKSEDGTQFASLPYQGLALVA